MVNPDKMTTEEITEAISSLGYAEKCFVECQMSIVEEIGLVMNDLVNKDNDKAFLRLRNLRDELVTDINITLKKELSTTNQDNA